MACKVILAAVLVAFGNALNVDDPAMSRRVIFAKVASIMPLMPLAALAEFKQASDAAVYDRAQSRTMNIARVIERAKYHGPPSLLRPVDIDCHYR